MSDKVIQRAEIRQSRIQSFAFVISVFICAVFSIGFAVSSLAAFKEPGGIELEERINPNDAPIASMVRLPGIGVARAEAIVAYRENFGEEGQSTAFQNSYDLQKIKGIGPKTVQNISEWLKFE
ncbi:MAG: ComEA family DNA-binding protein [Planctomycetota bacterium]